MKNDKLYIVKYEEEDDPYCAHWYETDLMTHDYDTACKKIVENIHKNSFFKNVPVENMFYDRRICTNFSGFIDVYSYDEDKKSYIDDHREYVSKYQISNYDVDFSKFNDEFVDFMKMTDSNFYEHVFEFPINVRVIGNKLLKTSFSITIKKKRFGDNEFGKWIVYIEGCNESNVNEYYTYHGNASDEGIYDLSRNWHLSTKQEVIDFGHNILGWSGSDFRKKFKESIENLKME